MDNQNVSDILTQISLLANLVNALLSPYATFGMLTPFHNAIDDIFPEENFWAFFEELDSFFDQLTQTQLHFLLNALIFIFRQQDCSRHTDGEKKGHLSPPTVNALESLLKAGAKPFHLMVEYVVETGNAGVLLILCQNNALDHLSGTHLCNLIQLIHVGRPWEYSQFEVLVVLFMYGKALNIQDHLRNLFGRFLTEGTVCKDQYGATVRYVGLLTFGLPELKINGLKKPNGVKIADEWKPLLQQLKNCRESTFTLLGIFRKRRDAFPSNAFPKEIALMIALNVWDSRSQDAWEQAPRPSDPKRTTR